MLHDSKLGSCVFEYPWMPAFAGMTSRNTICLRHSREGENPRDCGQRQRMNLNEEHRSSIMVHGKNHRMPTVSQDPRRNSMPNDIDHKDTDPESEQPDEAPWRDLQAASVQRQDVPVPFHQLCDLEHEPPATSGR